MTVVQIVDLTDEASFALVPPCADPAFDHRSCTYWEDADRGSKRARPPAAALAPGAPTAARRPPRPHNPFADDEVEPAVNPFAPPARDAMVNPFAPSGGTVADNPFAPTREVRPSIGAEAPRKLALLARGAVVFGSYAKVLLVDDEPRAYAQFGPLSAYPRASRVRELYRQLPDAPLPAVITCIATTTEARSRGYARTLVAAVCDDLASRGFSAVEVYPEVSVSPDATSAASPGFWLAAGFRLAVDDERFPVLRREL
jgi:ribosomal protein S18 acetylase RimI-like enzyme